MVQEERLQERETMDKIPYATALLNSKSCTSGVTVWWGTCQSMNNVYMLLMQVDM